MQKLHIKVSRLENIYTHLAKMVSLTKQPTCVIVHKGDGSLYNKDVDEVRTSLGLTRQLKGQNVCLLCLHCKCE